MFCVKIIRVFRIAVGCILIIASAHALSAGDAIAQSDPSLARALEYIEHQRYRMAIDQLEPLADSGNAEAQYRLGVLFHDGMGIKRNINRAAKLFVQAADGGSSKAQFQYAAMLMEGRGIKKNKPEGRKYMKMAALQGVPAAMHYLGRFHQNGEGGPQDYVAAYTWFELAVRNGADYSEAFRDLLPQVLRDHEIKEAIKRADTISRQFTETNQPSNENPKQPVATMRVVGTGTGFIVDKLGAVLTNHHVVNGCRSLRARQGGNESSLNVIKTDPELDLALLRLDVGVHSVANFGGYREIRLGEEIVVVGYPLSTELGNAVNVTTGVISSLSGINGDKRFFQFSAPVNPGNSGGPVVNALGAVVGVVTHRLDPIEMARQQGVLPQNVNFAVKPGNAVSFLLKAGVEIKDEANRDPLSTVEVSEIAQKFTIQIECLR
jgi:uncharacterized protein